MTQYVTSNSKSDLKILKFQCYVFDVLDKKYNGYTQAELKDIGNDVLALHADEMYGILFSYHHSSHQPWYGM